MLTSEKLNINKEIRKCLPLNCFFNKANCVKKASYCELSEKTTNNRSKHS